MRGVHSAHGGKVRFPASELVLTHERVAVVGPNGSGKSTLLQVLMGDLAPDDGFSKVQWSRVGYVGQHAQNWQSEQSLVERLLIHSAASLVDEPANERVFQVAELLARHKFPFALAERPFYSLSPGERTRAALIELFHRTPRVELLVLDEPTVALDLLGLASLEQALAKWQGGLLVVSHDEEFLESLRIERRIQMGRAEEAESSTLAVLVTESPRVARRV
jgi:ATPase subunit of ABC transporter with duplicated ATPase domains